MGGAFSAATGFIKAEDAAESFASKFQHQIHAKKDRVKTTFAMMRDGLSRSYNEQEVDFIINNITKFDNGKFGLQINYNNCSSYQEKRYFDKSLNIYEMSELKKNATSSVCERIAKVMQQAQNNQELAAFEKNLKDIMLSPIRKLYGDAAKPLISLGVNELISLAINKFNKPKADNDNEEQKSEEKAQEEEAEKITKQEKEEKENFDIAKKIQEDAEKAREQTETIVSDHEKRMAEKTNSCNSGKGICYGETFGPEMQERKLEIKPKIEFFARKVDYTGWIPGCDPYCQHGYTIFTFSDGKKIIVTGFPEKNNMITGNLQVVVTEYSKENTHLFPKSDWDENHKTKNKRASITTHEFNSDKELNQFLNKVKEASNYINHGNNGQRFDYDLCVSDSCWGSNSNTVQSYIYKQMGLELKIPEDVNLPGINGKFYDGPMDNLMKRWGEELQKEQP